MEKQEYQERREAWTHFLRYLPLHHHPWTRLIHRDGSESYSSLGVGLHAIQDRDPQAIRWENPIPVPSRIPADQGLMYQAVDDTTETLAEYYAINLETIGEIEEMDSQSWPREKLKEMILGAPFTLSQE